MLNKKCWPLYFAIIILLCSFISVAQANQCNVVFPSGINSPLPGSEQLNNFPTNNSGANLASGVTLPRGDNFYSKDNIGNNGTILVGAVASGQTTARLYIKSKVTWKNVKINQAGNPEDLVIIIDGSLAVTGGNTVINALVYVKGSLTVNGNATLNGAYAVAGSATLNGATVNYNISNVNNANFNGMCTQPIPIPISCGVGLPSLAYSDDFTQLNNGWKTVDFNRAISNWPNGTILQSPGQNQQVTAVITGGQLTINGTVTIGDNEYGMVRNKLEHVGINVKTTNNYAVAIDLTANKVGLNNDVGLVFGYINDSNYYLARWTKYGTGYASNTTFPGTYRRLELIKVSNGVVSSLGFKDNFDVSDPFNLKVVVNTQGTAVCVNDVAQLYSATEQPIVHDIGIYSYDNDVGVLVHKLAVYCNNCRIIKPVAEYRFDECYFTGNVGDVADKNKTYPATSFGGVAITTNGQIQNAADFSHYSHHIETSVPLPASFSLTTWFKKPTSTTDSKFFVLASFQSNGDILYIDRSNGWKWGVFTASPFGTTNGTYSFASLDNNWHHLGLVSAGGQTKLFIDGVLVDSVNRTVTGTFKYIGTSFESINTVNAQSFRAPLDEFSIFQEILTAAEINTIYQNQLLQKDFEGKVRKTKICNGLLGLYSFEQTSFAANIIDSSARLKNGKNKGGISIAAGKFCRGFDTNGNNSTSTTSNAFKSGLDLVKDVGIKGSVSFWYKSNSNWNAGGFSGGERVLFDASKDKGLGVINKYFYLGIKSDGRLSFAFEDSIDGDYRLDEPVSSVRTANTWYYVSTTWNFATNTYQLYVDGNLLSSQFINTNGAIKDLGKIIFGDNASKYAANGDVFLPSYTSSNGQFDEVRIYNKVLNQAEIQADMNNGGSCSNLDHFEIIHDGNGLTCAAETVTIKACTNTNCSTLSTNAVTLNFQGNAVTKSSTTFTGSTTVSFNHAVAETLALSVANPTIAPTNVLVCSNGSTNSCNMIFADTGFRFLVNGAASNIPTQLSGKPSNTGYHSANLALQAIKTNPATGACEAALTSSVVVEVAAKCTNPTSCAGQVVNINGVNINTLNNNATLSYSNLTFDFGNNVTNSAAMTFNYPDAGRIKLYARYNIPVNGTPSGNFMSGSSNGFVVRPLGFYVDVTGNPAAQNATGGIFKKAGAAFSTTIKAVQWQSGDDTNNNAKPDSNAVLSNNTVTPNFSNENNPESVVITNSIVAPNAGVNPSLTNNVFSSTSFVNGVATRNDLSWSEVGVLRFDVGLFDSQYIGTSNVTSTVPYVGRFIPDHLGQTVVTQGTLTGTCGAGSWVYSGQKDQATQLEGAISYAIAPKLRISAYNAGGSASGNITQNYTTTGGEGFMRLLNTGINITTPTIDLNQAGVSTTTALTGTITTGTLAQSSAGVQDYTLAATDDFTYTHNANSKIPPYIAEIPLAVNSITDQDGVTATTTVQAVPTGVKIRFGRLAIANSFGPETANLAQKLTTEYLNNNGKFVANTEDNCSSFNSTNVTLSNISLVPNGLASAVSGLFVNGVDSSIELKATGAGNQGQIGVTYNTFPWFEYDWDANGVHNNNPSAVATFGLFRGNDRVIYWREVNN